MTLSRTARASVEAIGALATSLALFFGLSQAGVAVVRQWVPPVPGVTRTALVADFEEALVLALGVTAALLIVWFALTHVGKVVRPGEAGKRGLWFVLGAGALVASVLVGVAFFEDPLSGSPAAYAVAALSASALFYIPTALFTPASFKYAAPGSPWVRGRLPY